MAPEDIDSSEFGVVSGPKKTSCPCGWANKDNKRVIGGTETGVNEYPFMAGLMSRRYKTVLCGGSIITAYHVLTAAHCTEPMKEAKKEMAVVVGDHDLIKRTETTATKIINVKESIEHENYWKLGHPNDIAILVLEEKIEFNSLVGRVCWGRTTPEGHGSNVLLKTNLRVVPTAECNTKLPIKLPLDIPRVFCAFEKNKDSCKGDSGGPLVWLDRATNRYVQVGLVSWGMSCSADKPSVNTNVAFYLDWIREKIKGI
ncbi:hypothetical protein AAG570_013214 [Ranatra chinensis]|uniref:Peptidase S1 domain-containing protein n=1 Tax=Ranatra chinensis TaxID=642074 RepID=A0ABD0YG36_9HEMI